MAMELYQGARRANRSGGLVQLAGDLGLASAFSFWAWIFWGFTRPTFTTPQHLYSVETIITGLLLAAFTLTLALCSAVVMPALMAAIFPHTAAAQYLQEIRRSAWGFWLLAVSCGLLAVFSFYILNNWWLARMAEPQPDGSVLVDLWMVRAMALMTFIFFVIVPSWAANYGTPVIWLTEVQQAHQVERLKMVHKQQLAIAKAGYRRAMSIMRAGLDTATVEQRTYVADMVVGMHQAEQAMMIDIANTIGDDLRLEQALPTYDDPAITDNYRQLHHLLVNGTPVLRDDFRDEQSHEDSRLQSSIPRETRPGIDRADLSMPSSEEDDSEDATSQITFSTFDMLAAELPTPFMAKDVQTAMKWSDIRQAQREIKVWKQRGWAEEVRLGRYRITEKGRAG